MDRRPTLVGWRQRLEAAAQNDDWTALAQADQELAAGLPSLAAAGPWSTPERTALQQLQATHERARRRCAATLSRIGGQLDAMRQQREGWLAYAGGNAWDTE
ncbi:hypothetical protein V4F39_16995 [Aquincola sp. MAHUQ-54]|uniref:Flagellar protein FliT n=1 Tax=Aquincola agrisoli TaxID=3119538 RepID=A0AAW9QJ15_9BURK